VLHRHQHRSERTSSRRRPGLRALQRSPRLPARPGRPARSRRGGPPPLCRRWRRHRLRRRGCPGRAGTADRAGAEAGLVTRVPPVLAVPRAPSGGAPGIGRGGRSISIRDGRRLGARLHAADRRSSVSRGTRGRGVGPSGFLDPDHDPGGPRCLPPSDRRGGRLGHPRSTSHVSCAPAPTR
jgi:hypothetical protein